MATREDEFLKNPEVRKEYDKLQPKYDLIKKQLKIREGIAKSIFERFTNGSKPWDKCTSKHKDIFLRRADLILLYLLRILLLNLYQYH